ncbi:unnamed protein product, partial [Polarella glacialis]
MLFLGVACCDATGKNHQPLQIALASGSLLARLVALALCCRGLFDALSLSEFAQTRTYPRRGGEYRAGNLEELMDLMVLIEAGPLARPGRGRKLESWGLAWAEKPGTDWLVIPAPLAAGSAASERFADVVGRLSKAHSQADLSTFNARALANTLHAWAVLRLRDEGPLHKLCARLESALGECNGQELASILYSLGLLGARQMPLLKSACQLVPKRLGQFSAQDS